MAHNTKEIIELIGKRPGIRLVEIADAVDCDPDQVLWALTDQLLDGSVIKSEVKAPNGHMQPSFTLRDQPKVEPAPEEKAKPTVQKTKVQLALDYLATVDKADDVAMRKAMGLHIGGNVRAYISGLLANRKVIQVQGGYKLGDGKPLPTPAAPVPKPKSLMPVTSANAGMNLQNAEPRPIVMAGVYPAPGSFGVPAVPEVAKAVLSDQQKELLRESSKHIMPLSAMLEQSASPVPTGPFRCAIWSDNGALTLMRGGLEIVTLTPEETSILQTYMDNMRMYMQRVASARTGV